jgi:ornithine carbamoyltransferase
MPLRHYTSVLDLTRDETLRILQRAAALKQEWNTKRQPAEMLHGYTLAAIYEKPSLRTRVTFEAGMTQLGGHSIYLSPADIQLGKRESVADVARSLSRWVQIIMARTFDQRTITDLAANSSVPVINGLSNLEHPCQALADFLTFKEHIGAFEGKKLAYIGDGNNVAHSLLLMGALLGVDVAVATPAGYEPQPEVVKQAQQAAARSGTQIGISNDLYAAAQDADAIYTDVWASMGQENEADARKKIFAPYQVTTDVLAQSNKRSIFLHCLPAHRGEEVAADVIDGPRAVVFDQAENRLHVQKALMLWLLGR